MPFAGDSQPEAGLVVPGRRTRTLSRDSRGTAGRDSIHTLDAASIMDAFSGLGVICGVVGPTDSAMKTMRKADIVILDWLLKDGESRYTLKLIRELLAGEEADRNSLRIVAIYTGEARLEEISTAVFEELQQAGLDPDWVGETKVKISYRHGCVVLYAKSNVNLVEHLKSRSVAEEILPERLVEDFALMTRGLLPGIALTSLTAVREGAHQVLDQFSAELDPAFLAHRACLSSPENAEQQIVNHVAEELRGLMDNAVSGVSPASAKAVESWIRRNGTVNFVFGDRRLDLEQTIVLANKGLMESELRHNAFEGLSAGFAGHDAGGLDERLAWIMSSRTVYRAPPPILWLGAFITMSKSDGEQHLICMRPRCDCVRLNKETTFFFLPLATPKEGMEQIILNVNDTFERLGIESDPSGWVLRQFKPFEGNGVVTATKRESDGGFEFADTNDNRYKWRGELKAEYAQRIAQKFGTTLSRVAIDESEWLRRMARKGR